MTTRPQARSFGLGSAAWVLACLAAAHPLCGQTEVFITGFAKTNNIFTNLNEEFPHTDNGTGVPGSGAGTPNASFLFDPSSYLPTDYVAGSNAVNNGVTFQLTSDSSGHDFAEINGGSTLSLAVNQDATSAYLLMGAYNGTSCNVTFTGADGYQEVFNNVALPDFNGGTINTSAAVNNGASVDLYDQTLLRVHNVGAGGTGNSITGAYNYYDLTELSFSFNSHLGGESLTSISIDSNGYETLLLGVTVMAVPEPPVWQLLAWGAAAGGALGVRCRLSARHRSRAASVAGP